MAGRLSERRPWRPKPPEQAPWLRIVEYRSDYVAALRREIARHGSITPDPDLMFENPWVDEELPEWQAAFERNEARRDAERRREHEWRIKEREERARIRAEIKRAKRQERLAWLEQLYEERRQAREKARLEREIAEIRHRYPMIM